MCCWPRRPIAVFFPVHLEPRMTRSPFRPQANGVRLGASTPPFSFTVRPNTRLGRRCDIVHFHRLSSGCPAVHQRHPCPDLPRTSVLHSPHPARPTYRLSMPRRGIRPIRCPMAVEQRNCAGLLCVHHTPVRLQPEHVLTQPANVAGARHALHIPGEHPRRE
ncbi:hypothetical protein DENSPDRAFT_404216 [Dentipellis sp. KUC8613]|nr:hypothetical protein DENSPDRAFT_404216 [Dentipellis sp. KUC8613]